MPSHLHPRMCTSHRELHQSKAPFKRHLCTQHTDSLKSDVHIGQQMFVKDTSIVPMVPCASALICAPAHTILHTCLQGYCLQTIRRVQPALRGDRVQCTEDSNMKTKTTSTLYEAKLSD